MSNEQSAYGYLISNQVGANGGIGGQGGNGNLWAVNGGSWISTWSGGSLSLGQTIQTPRRAIMAEGTYEFAMSIQPMADNTAEIRWYIIDEDGENYLHSGTHIDTWMYAGTDSSTFKPTYNGFVFSHEGNDGNNELTNVDVLAVQVDLGDPIEIPEPIFSAFYISDWGAIGTRLASSGWTLDNDTTTFDGDAVLTGPGGTNSNWTAIRGGFGELPVTATVDEALIVRGEIEIDGEFTGWNPIRMGVFNHTDIGSLSNALTDSAIWGYTQYAGTDSATFVSNEQSAYGYLISNQVGANGGIGGQGGNGNLWAVNGGSWISTWSGGSLSLGQTIQTPRRANMAAGTYVFEMSIQPMANNTAEIRWYIMDEDGENYLHSGTHIDTWMYAGTDSSTFKPTYNGFVFSHEGNGGNEGLSKIELLAVQVDKGEPIDIPDPIFSPFYASDWGLLGGKLGGAAATDSAWSLTPGVLVGDVTIDGPALAGWANVATDFGINVTPSVDEALIVTAIAKFEGGGFETPGSFRFGIFDATLGGRDSTDNIGYVWAGAETGTGYVISPSAATGTMSSVNGGAWYTGATALSNHGAAGIAAAGEYELTLAVYPNANGGMEVAAKVENDGFRYEVNGTHNSPGTTKFNSLAFGVSNATTTSFTLEEVYINKVPPAQIGVSIEGGVDDGLPRVFALKQNYPNPFNPSTNIQFDLPQSADVKMTVYNMLGQKVMTLVDRRMDAGFHHVTFDARSLASGMYVYRIEAGSFVSTKKMMLIK